MAFKVFDRVLEYGSAVGSGPATLAGPPIGYRSFSSVFTSGDITTYLMTDGGANWEAGVGTLTSGTSWSLARATILASSNSGLAVAFPGQINIWCDAPAAMLYSPPANRNRVINGEFLVSQYNGTNLIIPAATGVTYVIDRFALNQTVGSKLLAQQNMGGVGAPVGFTNSLGVQSQAVYSPAATDNFNLEHRIESINVRDIGFGAAGAQPLTISFWVRTSVAGTYGASLCSSGATRSFVFTYSVPVIGTWTYVSVTVPGDVAGTWLLTGAGVGLVLRFNFAAGSNFVAPSGSVGVWTSSNYTSTAGCVSLLAVTSTNWYVTGIQVEAGVIPTPFERRRLTDVQRQCQRYYQLWYGGGMCGFSSAATQLLMGSMFETPMRIGPTMTMLITAYTANQVIIGATSYTTSASALVSPSATSLCFAVQVSGFTGIPSAGLPVTYNINATPYLSFQAEI